MGTSDKRTTSVAALGRLAAQWVALAMVFTMAGCALPQATAPGSLADTSWSLRSIQSMDDRQGTTRIDDPSRVTIRFGADGRAAMKLDCNRGTATWEAAPAADGKTGALRFGPIAGTRALCPPPHIDERVIRDLANVAGYRFADGKLYLSLKADGGIYEWQPHRE